MFDSWEKAQWEAMSTNRIMIVDALARADDGLTEYRFETDKWNYAIVHLERAADELRNLIETARKVGHRRLDLEENQVETR